MKYWEPVCKMLLDCGNDKLFAKTVPVSIKDGLTNHTRTCQLFLTIEWQDSTAGLYGRKVLAISLTDDNDPFFLFNLLLSEEDFQSLKASQDLLINFSSFPQHIINFIEKCLLEDKNPQPEFILVFSINERHGNICSPSQLDIVQINQFKHLTHLSLRFVAATDSTIKQYLSNCFKSLKEERMKLQNRVTFLEHDSHEKLSSYQQTLNSKIQELDSLKREHEAEIAQKESQCKAELQKEKNKLISKQKEKECKMEKDWEGKENFYRKKIKELESELSAAQSVNKELQEKNSKKESAIRNLKTSVSSLEHEANSLKNQLQSYANQNNLMKTEIEEKGAHMGHQKNKIDELEQELCARRQVISKLREELDDALKERKVVQDDLDRYSALIAMNDVNENSFKKDISKLKGTISKLQKDVSAGFEKIKMKDKQISKQAHLIEEKETLVKKFKSEVEELKLHLESKSTEVESLTRTISSLEDRFHSMEKEVNTKDSVIKWLNRQLTDRCVVTQYTPPANFGPSPTAVAQKQLAKIRSDQVSSAPNLSTSTNITSKAPGTKLPSARKSTPSPNQLKSKATPSRFHSTGATDSAYCASPSELSNQISPIIRSSSNKDNTDILYTIDPAVLDTAFGTGDDFVETVVKKVPKSAISKFVKKR